MGKIITDSAIRGIAQGKRTSERIEPTGSLIIWHRKTGKEFYYRKTRTGEKEINIKLGNYPEMPLSVARQKAREMAEKATQVNDLKFYLEQEREKQRIEEEAAKRARERANSLGTLSDLCNVYVNKMKNEGRSSWKKVEESIERYVLKPYPLLAKRKANEITSDDIADVLASMIEKGITTHVNRTRGDLHAAFNVGLKYDFDPSLRTKSGLCFDIHFNPVARVPAQKQYERTLSRHLSADELKIVWDAAPQFMSPVYSALLQVMICTGFHPAELLRLKVSDVDQDEQAIYMIETKSGSPNLIPLNRFALEALVPLIEGRAEDGDLFPSHRRKPKSDVYARVSVLSNQVSKLRKSIEGVNHFTPRDIRRTVKTLMGKAGISKEMRDRLQNHALGDVSSKHYDRYDYWPEKQAAMLKWEGWLDLNVINFDPEYSNVIPITKNLVAT